MDVVAGRSMLLDVAAGDDVDWRWVWLRSFTLEYYLDSEIGFPLSSQNWTPQYLQIIDFGKGGVPLLCGVSLMLMSVRRSTSFKLEASTTWTQHSRSPTTLSSTVTTLS